MLFPGQERRPLAEVTSALSLSHADTLRHQNKSARFVKQLSLVRVSLSLFLSAPVSLFLSLFRPSLMEPLFDNSVLLSHLGSDDAFPVWTDEMMGVFLSV